MDKQEWLKKYKARMIERGLNEEGAQDAIDAAGTDEYLSGLEPEDAADEELSYWPSDG